MKLQRKFLPALLLCFIAPIIEAQQCDTGAPLAQKDVDAIVKQFDDKYSEAFNAGDIKALSALYTDDAVDIGELGGALQGRKAIQGALERTVKLQKIKLSNTTSIAVSSDVIVTYGSARKLDPVTGAPPPAPKPWDAWNGFLYSHVLVRRGDTWRLAAVEHALRPELPKIHTGAPKPTSAIPEQ